MTPEVAILVPHFQTLSLTTLCLRLLREHTWPQDYETIVIDNGSMDGSGEALKKLDWVRVIRRELSEEETPAISHGRALDFALEQSSAPLVVVIHTDTMMIRPDWLTFLVEHIWAGGRRTAAVGAWKHEPPGWRRPAKWMEHMFRAWTGSVALPRRFPRSSCAVYRRDALWVREHPFTPSPGFSPGEELHAALRDAEFSTILLDPILLSRYVLHLNHATLALNEQLGVGDRHVARTRRRALRRLNRFWTDPKAQRFLMDTLANPK